MAFIEKIIKFFWDWFSKLSDEEKKRYILIFTAIFAVLLTVFVFVSISGQQREKNTHTPERPNIFLAIPAEELFLPDEPDFLPGVLLEREKRSSWTEQDADEYWQDPLIFGEEQWRRRIEIAIDEILERVP